MVPPGYLALSRWCPHPRTHSVTASPQQDSGRKQDEKLVSQDKGGLMKESNGRARKERKTKQQKRKEIILYFPSADHVQPLPEK